MVRAGAMRAAGGVVLKGRDAARGKKFQASARKHSVYSWIETRPGLELAEITCEDVATKYGMPERVLKDHLNEELKSEKSVLFLPRAFVSLVLYTLMMLSHEGVHWNNSMEEAIEFDISENANFAFTEPLYIGNKNLQDVNSFADFWSWMNKGFVPLTIGAQYPTSEGSDVDLGNKTGVDRRRYMWHNLVVAPLRLAQQEAEDMPCPNVETAGRYGLACTGSTIDLDLAPVDYQIKERNFRENPAKTVWLRNPTEAAARLEKLEGAGWLHPKVDHVKVSMLMYNGDSDLLMTTEVNFLFARSGRIWKKITTMSMMLDPYHSPWTHVWDVLFYLQVTYLFFERMYELFVLACRQGTSPCKGLRASMSRWKLVDWIFISLSYVVLGIWQVGMWRVRSVRQQLVSAPSHKCLDRLCTDHFDKLFDHVHKTELLMERVRLFSAIVPIVIMLRLFKAFSTQPRLALVTDTLGQAWKSLSHYLIVFLAIFSVYAAMGVAFFGRKSANFATLDRAFPRLLLMMLGDFDFEDLEEVGRGYAFFFFMTFMGLVVLVMLSMLIAIIMDVYGEVKAMSQTSASLLLETRNIFRRTLHNRRKTRLSLTKIIPVLCVDAERLLRVEHLLDPKSVYYVEGLGGVQAKRLMTEAARTWAFRHSPEVKAGDIGKYVQDAHLSLMPLTSISATDAARTKLTLADETSAGKDGTGVGSDSLPEEKDALERVEVQVAEGEEVEEEEEEKGGEDRTQMVLDLVGGANLEQLLRAAELRLESREGLPIWEGSQQVLLQLVGAANRQSSLMWRRVST